MTFNKKLLENYYNSINKEYKAVCLDIDGTITKKNSKEINNNVVFKIKELLENDIPVIFITGRGETGTKRFIDNLVGLLINDGINYYKLINMYVLINDGARIIKSSNSYDKLFDTCECLVSDSNLKQLNDLNDLFKKDINLIGGLNTVISYSTDSFSNKLINIRLKIKNSDTRDMIKQNIIQMFNDSNFSDLSITEGIFEGNFILQIGTSVKQYAVEKASQIIGINEDDMLRIGDCGDKDGNDYTLLNCPQGFSTNKTSGNINGCFPIINKDNEVLIGSEATIELLNTIKFKKNKKVYSKKYDKL